MLAGGAEVGTSVVLRSLCGNEETLKSSWSHLGHHRFNVEAALLLHLEGASSAARGASNARNASRARDRELGELASARDPSRSKRQRREAHDRNGGEDEEAGEHARVRHRGHLCARTEGRLKTQDNLR